MQDEVEVKARELLAAEYERDGLEFVSGCIRHDADLAIVEKRAIRAIAAALRHRPVVDDDRMARALEWLQKVVALGFPVTSPEHLPAIEEAIAAYDPNCGGRTVHFANLGDSEAQFIEDGKNLDCPACGGSGHVGDVRVVDDAMVDAVWNALDPGDVPGLTRRKLRAALKSVWV